jgi:hypothetical protein
VLHRPIETDRHIGTWRQPDFPDMADASVHGHSLQSPQGKFIVHTTGEAYDTRVRRLFPFRGQMSRHFISTVICISILLVSASLSISINAAPRQQPWEGLGLDLRGDRIEVWKGASSGA